MKNYLKYVFAGAGGLAGVWVGLGALVSISFPTFLSYLFLLPLYEKILSILPLNLPSDTLVGVGFIGLICFSACIGAVYGLLLYKLILFIRKK